MNNDRYIAYGEIIFRILDSRADDEQFAEFDRLLREDAVFRRYYLRLMLVYTSLMAIGTFPAIQKEETTASALSRDLWRELAQEEKNAETVVIEKAREPVVVEKADIPKIPQKSSKLSLIAAITSMAALLLMIVFVHFNPRVPEQVATVSDMSKAVWADSSEAVDIGSRLFTLHSSLSLREGFVKIKYDRGAEVIIEGPAEFEIKSEKAISLLSGRLYAHVVEYGKGFTVKTPCSEMVDLGTEFGVKVNDEGDSELHVFRGEVVLNPGDRISMKTSAMHLTAGQAVQVLRDSLKICSVEFQKEAFFSYIPSPYEQYVKSINPFSYWRFEKDAANLLTDRMNPQTSSGRLTAKAVWTQGPSLGFGRSCPALQFSSLQDGMIVEMPRMSEKNGFTYVLWVRPDSISKTCFVVTESKVNPGVHREIGLDENGHFLQQARMDDKVINRFVGKTVVEPNQWYHIVVTGRIGQKKILYVNGRPDGVSQFEIGSEEEQYHNAIYFGQLPDYPAYKVMDHFQGAVCEPVIFDRLLSEQEVSQLYQSSRMPAK